MMSYLGRGTMYSECGYLYFNLNHPKIKEYAKEMKRMYDSDDLYKLQESHDSWVWDYVRKEFEKTGVKNHNIGDKEAVSYTHLRAHETSRNVGWRVGL